MAMLGSGEKEDEGRAGKEPGIETEGAKRERPNDGPGLARPRENAGIEPRLPSRTHGSTPERRARRATAQKHTARRRGR